MVWVLRNSKSACKFIKMSNVNPREIIQELDSMYLQRTQYTKGQRITKFFRTTLERGERFPEFLARLESARQELSIMFGYNITDDDFKSVMQENLMPEMISLYHSLNEQQAPLADIRRQLISLEAHIIRPTAEADLNWFRYLNIQIFIFVLIE